MVNIDAIYENRKSPIEHATDDKLREFRLAVRKAIEKEGYSVAEVAREAELSSHTVIHRLLRGEGGVSLSTAYKLSMTLGVSI